MDFWWYIIIGEAVTIIISILLAMRKKWRINHGTGDDPVEHYTKKRDELSGLEEESSVSSDNFDPVKIVNSLITLGIIMFVFWQIWSNLTPTMNEQMNITKNLLSLITVVGFIFVILLEFGLD